MLPGPIHDGMVSIPSKEGKRPDKQYEGQRSTHG